MNTSRLCLSHPSPGSSVPNVTAPFEHDQHDRVWSRRHFMSAKIDFSDCNILYKIQAQIEPTLR